MPSIESFLSARLFIVPQLAGERIYFLSNISGHLSLYAMCYGGSVPEPLLPPDIALHNPHLIGGYAYYAFPHLDKILVMIDHNGDEKYQPMLIPIDGGFPEPAFGYGRDGVTPLFANHRVHLMDCDIENGIVYFNAERNDAQIQEAYHGDLISGKLTKLAESEWGATPVGASEDHSKVLLADGYTMGDIVLYLWQDGRQSLFLGKPIFERKDGEVVPPNGVISSIIIPGGLGVLLASALFDDSYSLGYASFDHPGKVEPVKLEGVVHTGLGEMAGVRHLKGALRCRVQHRWLLLVVRRCFQ